MVRSRLWAALLAVMLMVVVGCGGDDASDETQAAADGGAGEALSMQFGISTTTFSANWYPFAAAKELGYFTDENLDVELVMVDGSGTLTEQIAAGKLTAGAPSMGAVLEARGAGLDVVDYYTAGYLFAFGIWVPEDSPIQTIADLEGKNIGITGPGGGETALVRASLAAEDIDPIAGAKLIPIGEGEATTADAIQKGRVDAYAASRFDLYALQVAGIKLREVTPEQFEALPGRGLITTAETLGQEREALVRFGRAYAKATLFCIHNKDACQEFTKKVGPEQWVDTSPEGDSQGSLVYDEEWSAHEIPEDQQFGFHDEQKMQSFIDLFAEGLDAFESYPASELMHGELLAEINEFDRDAVISEAESFESPAS